MLALWTAIFLSSAAAFAAEPIPQLDVGPSCRAAAGAAVSPNRNEDSCRQDEKAAQDRLAQEWGGFSVGERQRCTSLSYRGGSPSYVELLTCLELAKDAAALPHEDRLNGDIER